MQSDEKQRQQYPLNYRVAGDPAAPPLLLLHGITGSNHYWERAARGLGDEFRIVMPDLLGFGESPKPDLDYRLSVYVDSLEAFLDDLGLLETAGSRPLRIVGHSLGSLVALEFLARHPESVERLVAVSLPRHTSREEAHRQFLAHSVNYRRILGVNGLGACLDSGREVGTSVFFRYLTRFPYKVLRDSSKFTLRSLLTTLEHCLLDYRVDEVLERVPPVPTLMLHGSEDRVAPLDNVAHLEQKPGWRLRILEDTGHHVFLTHTRECLEIFRGFLTEEGDDEARGKKGLPPAGEGAAP